MELVVHQHMAAKGYTPKIVHYEERLTSKYSVVVMECIDGPTLDNCITQGKKFSKEFVKHCKEVVNEIHSKKCCHGNLRANNILVTNIDEEPQIKVIDFDW